MYFKKWLFSEEGTNPIPQNINTPAQNIGALLLWPTPTLPPPPQGWRPEFMELRSDAALASIANELLNKGVPSAQANIIGRRVADYVWNYSAKPWNVYKRVLTNLNNRGVDYQKALQLANQSSERAKAIHQNLVANGYKAAA